MSKPKLSPRPYHWRRGQASGLSHPGHTRVWKPGKIWAFDNIIKICPGPTLFKDQAQPGCSFSGPNLSLYNIYNTTSEGNNIAHFLNTHTYTKNVWEKPNLQINNDARVFLADSIEDHANIVALIQLDFIMNQWHNFESSIMYQKFIHYLVCIHKAK